MKKALAVLLILATANACKAEESKQVTELKKRCEQLSKETGEKYIYGSGELKHFNKTIVISDFPKEHNNPLGYVANFSLPEQKELGVHIKGVWANPDEEAYKLELEPLPVAMETGKKYQFCYTIIKRYVKDEMFIINNIDYPETIQLMKD